MEVGAGERGGGDGWGEGVEVSADRNMTSSCGNENVLFGVFKIVFRKSFFYFLINF